MPQVKAQNIDNFQHIAIYVWRMLHIFLSFDPGEMIVCGKLNFAIKGVQIKCIVLEASFLSVIL